MNFSVLQAVYKNDRPSFLDESLNSISMQSRQPKYIVLVKDGEISEELQSVLDKWSAVLPLRIIGYENNHGLAYALNYGLTFIDTDIVARMDSDDIAYPDRFEKQMKEFENDNDIVILGTGIKEFYIDSNNIKHEKIRLYDEFVTKTSQSLFKATPLGHPTLMIRTEVLKQYKYSENTSMNEDIDLWFRLLRDGYIIRNLQEPLLHFRITDGTFKRRSVTKAINEYKIYSKNLRKIFGNNIKILYPMLRLVMRFLPYSVNKKIYLSDIRKKFLETKKAN